MKLRPNNGQDSKRKQTLPHKNSDLITALEEAESREKARLRIAVPSEGAGQVTRFLKEKALPWRRGIILLISHGLSEETPEELEKLRSQKELDINWLSKTYSTMSFRTYEYSEVNRVLTMKLRSMLNENRMLKQAIEKAGFCNVPEDEWDKWSEATVKGYYLKYVFRSQS